MPRSRRIKVIEIRVYEYEIDLDDEPYSDEENNIRTYEDALKYDIDGVTVHDDTSLSELNGGSPDVERTWALMDDNDYDIGLAEKIFNDKGEVILKNKRYDSIIWKS